MYNIIIALCAMLSCFHQIEMLYNKKKLFYLKNIVIINMKIDVTFYKAQEKVDRLISTYTM